MQSVLVEKTPPPKHVPITLTSSIYLDRVSNHAILNHLVHTTEVSHTTSPGWPTGLYQWRPHLCHSTRRQAISHTHLCGWQLKPMFKRTQPQSMVHIHCRKLGAVNKLCTKPPHKRGALQQHGDRNDTNNVSKTIRHDGLFPDSLIRR